MEICSKHGPYSVLCRHCDLDTLKEIPMTDNQPTASGVSEEIEGAAVKICLADGQDWRELGKTYNGRQRQHDYKRFAEAALSAKPAQTEQIASVRRCVEWAIPQLNCGNMSKDGFFDYLVSLFGTISAHEAVRDMQARWRRDRSERDHLRYVLSREPAQGGDGALVDIAAECKRHIDEEGWTPEHDDEHVNGELSAAAACYAGYQFHFFDLRKLWPWDYRWWKPTNRRRDLIKAGALIVAEIERLDRAERKSP